MKVVYGIDIGGTSVKIGVFDLQGKQLHAFRVKTDLSEAGANILQDIANAIDAQNTLRDIKRDDILGYGMGVPGPVVDGLCSRAPNLAWFDVDVVSEFRKAIGYEAKVAVGNDATVAAAGEFWKGRGEKANNMVLFTLGTGVGGGVILDGRVIQGKNGASGEIGHIDVGSNLPCTCGLRGCLETVASARGIVSETKRLIVVKAYPTKLKNTRYLNARTVLNAAKEEDPLALAVIEGVGLALAKVMTSVAATVDPDLFVLGGGVSKAGQILVDVVEKHYRERAFFAFKDTKVGLASLGNDAGMTGAAYIVLVGEK